MKRRAYRFMMWLLMAAAGATLFQTYPLYPISGDTGTGFYGCTRFAANSTGNVIDWCWLLDCQNGFFGGLIDPCADPSSSPWLLDCANYTGDTDTTDTTTGGTTGGTTNTNQTTNQ